jgi:hypothetical protein
MIDEETEEEEEEEMANTDVISDNMLLRPCVAELLLFFCVLDVLLLTSVRPLI